MPVTRNIRMLTRYNAWANARLFATLAGLDRRYEDYSDTLSDAAHDGVLHFRMVDGGGAMARGDMLLHVVNHKPHHRGYLADLLHQTGPHSPVMDLPVFLRDAPPALMKFLPANT